MPGKAYTDPVQEDISCQAPNEDDLPGTPDDIGTDGSGEAVTASAMAGTTGPEYVDATPTGDPGRDLSDNRPVVDPGKDITGQTFGNWTVLEYVRTTPHGSIWCCQCKCGTVRNVWGAQLKAGRTRSCGGPGCKMKRSHNPTLRRASDDAMDERTADISRFYKEMNELNNPKMWRCRPDGTLYPVALINTTWSRWGAFVDWCHLAGGYKRGKVLCVKKDWTARCPMNQAFPDGPQGIVLSGASMEWVWPDVAREEERELVIKPEKEYHYKDPTDGKVYTRAQLAEKYGIHLGTFNSRLNRGWTIEKTCLTKPTKNMSRTSPDTRVDPTIKQAEEDD